MMATRSWGEVLPPSLTPFNNKYYHHHYPIESSNWQLNSQHSSSNGIWTQEQNKRFEDALAQFDKDTPDRWEKVASLVPGKSPREVADHYRNLEEDVCQIEAGNILCPEYGLSSLMFDWDFDSYGCVDGVTKSYCVPRRRSGCRASDQELRKKGVPWTEEEHKLFLLGLKKYGKGDWRNISRNFVITRTPTQVASHAQKYFIRLKSGGKDKRRSSIHDITTANLLDNQALSSSQTPAVSSHSAPAPASIGADSDGSSGQGNQQQFMQKSLGMSRYVTKFSGQSSQKMMVPNNNVLF